MEKKKKSKLPESQSQQAEKGESETKFQVLCFYYLFSCSFKNIPLY